MRATVNREQFATTWNASDSVIAVAEHFGMTSRRAIEAASRCRKSGMQLKSFHGREQVEIVCPQCGNVFAAYECNNRTYCSRPCKYNARASLPRVSPDHSRLRGIWAGMKARCEGRAKGVAIYYHDRGITVCSEWSERFELFRDWALANGYQSHLEIDRKDTNGGYSPENCRWATRTEQMRNTRKRSSGTTSRFKGVAKSNGKGRWRATIVIDKAAKHIGCFGSEEEAAKAYDTHAMRAYGEFAVLNFPKETSCL